MEDGLIGVGDDEGPFPVDEVCPLDGSVGVSVVTGRVFGVGITWAESIDEVAGTGAGRCVVGVVAIVAAAAA